LAMVVCLIELISPFLSLSSERARTKTRTL